METYWDGETPSNYTLVQGILYKNLVNLKARYSAVPFAKQLASKISGVMPATVIQHSHSWPNRLLLYRNGMNIIFKIFKLREEHAKM